MVMTAEQKKAKEHAEKFMVYLESTPQPKGVEITAFSDKMCYNNCTGIM